MGWLKNVTTVRKWGASAANVFMGMTEEITEVYYNFTSNMTYSVNEIRSLDLKNINPENLKKVSKTLVLGYSTVSVSKNLRSGLTGLISGATTNLLY